MSKVDWIPVTERLPEPLRAGLGESATVLVWWERLDMVHVAYYDFSDQEWREMDGELATGVTHWAELPEGPPCPPA